MNPISYCEEKAAPSGSDNYYALLGLAPETRNALLPLMAFACEVSTVPRECHDTDVAIRTLDWWRQQVAAVYRGDASHPVCQALLPVIQAHDLPDAWFMEIIDGHAMDIGRETPFDRHDLQLYQQRTASTLCLMQAEITCPGSREAQKFAARAGNVIAGVRDIQMLGYDVRLGRHYLDKEVLTQHGLDASQLYSPVTPDALGRLLAQQAQLLRSNGKDLISTLDRGQRVQLRYLVTRLRLSLRLLERIADDGFRVMEHQIHLTPLGKWWIAWRGRWS